MIGFFFVFELSSGFILVYAVKKSVLIMLRDNFLKMRLIFRISIMSIFAMA